MTNHRPPVAAIATLTLVLIAAIAAFTPPTAASKSCPPAHAQIANPAQGMTTTNGPTGSSSTPSPDGNTYVISGPGQGIPWTVHVCDVWMFTITISITNAAGMTWTDSATKGPQYCQQHTDVSGVFMPPITHGQGQAHISLTWNPCGQPPPPTPEGECTFDEQVGKWKCWNGHEFVYVDP